MTKYIIDEEKIEKEFTDGQVKGFMKDLGFNRFETLIYLWAFNHFHFDMDDLEDLGRPVYKKLAKCLSKIVEEENDDNKE